MSVFTQNAEICCPDRVGEVFANPELCDLVFTTNQVLAVLSILNVYKSSGPDEIPARILKETAHKIAPSIPANFFWDVGVRFLSWECWDFWRRHDHFRRFPKKSEVFRSLPKASSLPVLFTSKIIDLKEGIVIYSFYTWFSFLTWVWVNIFLEIVSSKTATTRIFQSGVRNWPTSVSRHEIEVFNPKE